jgi:predicted PurR-regulated permease PerM
LNRSTVSLLVPTLLLLLLLWLAPHILLTVFAGILMAVFLRMGGDGIAAKTGISQGAGLTIFCVMLALALSAFFAFAGAALATQAQQLIDQLPGALDRARGYVDGNPWVQRLIDQFDLQSMMPTGGGATTALTTTFGAFGDAVVILFIGIYGAIEPNLYRRGAVALVAPEHRPRAAVIFTDASIALRGWLRAQFISMAVVGVLTGLASGPSASPWHLSWRCLRRCSPSFPTSAPSSQPCPPFFWP